jgi:predicted RND superfamily exporter protein
MELIPDDVRDVVESDNYQLLMVMSEYKVASDEVNHQCEVIDKLIKEVDSGAMLVGEAPCTKDLIDTTAVDFRNVNIISIAVIAVIIALVFRSASIPVLLVSAIEFAIFINLGIPHYTGTVLPFVASIVIGTIQLGSTVDYAILLTNNYKEKRLSGFDRKESVRIALQKSITSIIVSGLTFFSATFGVGLYSKIDMISSLCTLMARGAIISMFTVILVVPAFLILFDRLIVYSTIGFGEVRKEMKKHENIVGGKHLA